MLKCSITTMLMRDIRRDFLRKAYWETVSLMIPLATVLLVKHHLLIGSTAQSTPWKKWFTSITLALQNLHFAALKLLLFCRVKRSL